MAKVPHADEGLVCPLHKVDMSLVCHKCPWWSLVRGQNPQTGDMIDDWRCAIALLPMLLIENANQSRQTGAAVESFRNGVVQGVTEAMHQATTQQMRLVDARNANRS